MPIGDSAAVDGERADIHTAVVAEQAIKGVDRLAGSAGNHRLMQRRIAIGDRRVDFDDWVTAIVRVDLAAGLTGSSKVERLTVTRSADARTEPFGERLGVDRVGQTAERRAERLLAHMPHLHPGERPSRACVA